MFMIARRDTPASRNTPRHDLGRKSVRCPSCDALFWLEERKAESSQNAPRFQTCCAAGRVRLTPFQDLPPELLHLLRTPDADGVRYRKGLRAFNSMFGFTSSGANYDREMANDRAGVYTYRIQGAVYHLISRGLLPEQGRDPNFAQIYIYDTDYQVIRRGQLYPEINPAIIRTIQGVLERDNPHVRHFMSHSIETLEDQPSQDFEFVVDGTSRDRRYDLPTASEVAVLLPGDGSNASDNRDIVLRKREGGLRRISQLDRMYDPLHYVLLFPHGCFGWSKATHQPDGITQLDFYSFHLQERNEHSRIVYGGRLMQEYVVDAYAKVEESRLHWVRQNQTTLRADLYGGLADQVHAEDAAATGRLIVLPATFTGGPRYMQALYQDAMAIV